MTIRELKEIVDFTISQLHEDEDLNVCIPNNQPSIGPISTTDIIHASKGFDWESSRFILVPKNKMIEHEGK